MSEQAAPNSGLRSAAMLLLSLGEQPAAEVLKLLGAKDVQRIGTAMSELGSLSRAEVGATLDQLLEQAETHASIGVGTDEYIRSMLTNALGEGKANGLIDRIFLGRSSKGLETLKWMDARSIADSLRNEHPQTIAVVLAYLEAEQAGEIVMRLSESVRPEVLARVALLDGVQPNALSRLDEIIERQFSGGSAVRTASLGGAKAAANILNTLGQSEEGAILTQIRSSDQGLAAAIEELIFTFEDLVSVADRDVQELLRAIPSEALVPALKATEESVRTKIFKNMSQRAAEMLRDDLESSGPIKLSDAEAAQKQILTVARQLAEAGTITLGSKGDGYV